MLVYFSGHVARPTQNMDPVFDIVSLLYRDRERKIIDPR
jgi:hypothetical protein